MSTSRDVPDVGISPELIRAAQMGSEIALEELFRRCQPYLLRMANDEFPEDLRAKAGASDLVQQSCLEAHKDFDQFKGQSAEELKQWLRRILLNNQANFIRLFRHTGKRQVGREKSLQLEV